MRVEWMERGAWLAHNWRHAAGPGQQQWTLLLLLLWCRLHPAVR